MFIFIIAGLGLVSILSTLSYFLQSLVLYSQSHCPQKTLLSQTTLWSDICSFNFVITHRTCKPIAFVSSKSLSIESNIMAFALPRFCKIAGGRNNPQLYLFILLQFRPDSSQPAGLFCYAPSWPAFITFTIDIFSYF